MWPPHGYRHTITATQSPPHGHRHTITATRPQPPLAGSRAGSCAGLCDESCARLCVGTFNHGNSPKALGPLAPTATPSLWPAATLSSWRTPFVNHGRWRPLSLGGPRPSAASDLRRPLAHGAPLATAGYQGVVVIRNGRVIKPIVRGGGLGGMSWWCGGMSWKWCGRKAKGHEGLLGVDATGWPTPQGKAPSRGIAPTTLARGPRALLPRISVSFTAAWWYLARGVSVLMPLAGYDRATDARGSGRGRNIGYRLCTLVVL